MGQYNIQAFRVVMDEVMCGLSGKGRKPKTKYFEEPKLWKFLDESELTDEEREKKETEEAMRKEIASMDAWIAGLRKSGLPETKIKEGR